MANSEWRATLRAADIPRRPPHTQRPGERVVQTTIAPPRRVVIPMAALEQAQNESIAEELGLPLDPQPSSYAPPPTTLAPSPETQPSAPLAATEMAAKRKHKGTRAVYTDEQRAQAMEMFWRVKAERAKEGFSGRNSGATAIVSKKLGIAEGVISNWSLRERARREGEAASGKTLASSPQSAPMSRVSVSGQLPPLPTVTLQGLEEYINAIVDRRIKERLAAMLGGG